MSYGITFIDFLRFLDMSVKLYNEQIALNDGEMIALRNIFRQLDESEKQFIREKYGEEVDFLENYQGVRKRKNKD
ncbi:hypothetical protein EJF36_03400 [Bacillus sp. HMF5848]|uniref:hypothetical protein n=1 Tax=Bacillus sp. HMF5848 TaxID=2495421 RepID=UPI000F7AF5D1|nr:hypothetical protein [Bacillus sp. HMF5848]RSK26019.1 hypothetical protein EJF36_03400 [Bacillus sp. HMF5848]